MMWSWSRYTTFYLWSKYLNWVNLNLYFTQSRWYQLCCVPWTAGWQTAAENEPPNPVNPLVVSLFGGWKRTRISTGREKDKINQRKRHRCYFERMKISSLMPRTDGVEINIEKFVYFKHIKGYFQSLMLDETGSLTLTLMTLISTAIRSPYRTTNRAVMQNLRYFGPTWYSANFTSLMDFVMNANTQ